MNFIRGFYYSVFYFYKKVLKSDDLPFYTTFAFASLQAMNVIAIIFSLKLFIDYSFNILNLHQLYCNITKDNQRSLNLFTNIGFVVVGEKKQWIKYADGWLDEYLLQKINNLPLTKVK